MMRSGSMAIALWMSCAVTASAAPFAYVPNEGSGTVSVIDTASDTVVAEIAAGSKPRGIAVSRDGSRVFVSDQPANALLVIDAGHRRVESSIPLGESPEGVYISPDGALFAAASEISNAVILIDAHAGKEVG